MHREIRDIGDIPDSVRTGLNHWPTDGFRRKIVTSRGEYDRRMKQVQALPPPELPDIPISLSSVVGGEFEKTVYGERYSLKMSDQESPLISGQPPLQQLTICESILNEAANHLAWKNMIYKREGYSFLRAGYHRDGLTSGGYPDGFPNYFAYLPDTFSSKVFKYLIATQSARRELMELDRNFRILDQQGRHLVGEAIKITVADSPANIGCNRHHLAEYLLGIFRGNIREVDILVERGAEEQEKAMRQDLKEWGKRSRLVLDTRVNRGFLSKWLEFLESSTIPILPKDK